MGTQVSEENLTYTPRDIHRYAWIRQQSDGFTLEVGAQDGSIWRADFGSPVNLQEEVVLFDCDVWKQNVPSIFVRGDGHNLPFKDGTFETVVLDHILEHVPHPDLLLQEAKRVSRNKIVVNVPDERSWDPSLRPNGLYGPDEVETRIKKIGYDELIRRQTFGHPTKFAECLRYVDEKKFEHFWHRRVFTSDMFRDLMVETGLYVELFKLRYHHGMFVDFAAILYKGMNGWFYVQLEEVLR